MYPSFPPNSPPNPPLSDADLCQLVWPSMKDEVHEDGFYFILAEHVRYEMLQSKRALDSAHYTMDQPQSIQGLMASVRSTAGRALRDVARSLSWELTGDQNQDKEALEVLRFAASLVSMTQIRTMPASRPGEEDMPFWKRETSLKETLMSQFSTVQNRTAEANMIPPELTLRHIVVNYEYVINWTSCLREHLEIDRKRKVISVFQHKIWLSAHAGSEQEDESLLPPSVVGEALDTLNLLFPPNDQKTEDFLDEQKQKFNHLLLGGGGLKSDLNNYHHWRKHLEDLIAILKGPPVGFRQFLPRPDQPNLLESVNFWIAAFVAILAVISFIFGLIAVIYAKQSLEVSKESLELTRLQYLLSIAQACSNPDEASLLPEFCNNA